MPHSFNPVKRFLLAVICLAVILGAESAFARSIDSDIDDLIKALETYTLGKDSTVLAMIDEKIREAGAVDPEQRKALHARLEEAFLQVLQSENATRDAKEFACRKLRNVGGLRAVPVIGSLFKDEALAEIACYALQPMPYAEVDTLLIRSVAGASPSLRIALCNIIAQRATDPLLANGERRAQALKLLSGEILNGNLLNGDQPKEKSSQENIDLVDTMLAALGRIGNPAAAAVLLDAKVIAESADARLEACIVCADQLRRAGLFFEAAPLYRIVYAEGNPVMLRIAALNGLVQCKDDDSVRLITMLLYGDDLKMKRAAAQCMTVLQDPEAITTLAQDLSLMPEDSAFLVLTALCEAGATHAAPIVEQVLKGPKHKLHTTAIHALGALGSATHVPLLAKIAAEKGVKGKVAASSLARLRGPGVNDAILEQATRSEGEVRAALIRSMGARGARELLPSITGALDDPEYMVREQALTALEKLVSGDDLPMLIDLMMNGNKLDVLDGLIPVMTEACLRADEPDPLIKLLSRALLERDAKKDGTASDDKTAFAPNGADFHELARGSLARVLGNLPCPLSLKALCKAAEDEASSVRVAAMIAFGNWPDVAPTPALLKLAERVAIPEEKTLLIKGLLNMAGLLNDRADEETKQLYKAAEALAFTPEDKASIIRSISNVHQFWVLDFLAPYEQVDKTRNDAIEALARVKAALSLTVPHDASGCPVTLAYKAVFNPEGPKVLTDNKYGSDNFRDGNWQGFKGKDCLATVDLGRNVEMRSIRARFMKETRSWIFLPVLVEFSVSTDNENFTMVASFDRPVPAGMEDQLIDDIHASINGQEARYVRVFAKSLGTCPDWHPGAGRQCWTFIDEIQVNPHLDQ